MGSASVAICTVSAGEPNWQFMESVTCMKAPGRRFFKRIAGHQGVDDGHNRAIEWFLTYTDFEWMLSLDTDAKVHHETLLRLMSWDVKFVSALAFQRKPPFLPVVYTEAHPTDPNSFGRPLYEVVEWIKKHPELADQVRTVVLDPKPEDALWEVFRGGAHCCLTHRSVLEAIEPPWFVRGGLQVASGRGSDFTFHRKVKEAGFKTYVDMSVVAGHTAGDLCIGALDFLVWNVAGKWDDPDIPTDVKVVLPKSDKKEE